MTMSMGRLRETKLYEKNKSLELSNEKLQSNTGRRRLGLAISIHEQFSNDQIIIHRNVYDLLCQVVLYKKKLYYYSQQIGIIINIRERQSRLESYWNSQQYGTPGRYDSNIHM